MSSDRPKRFEFNLPIKDMDALCIETFSVERISMFYSYERTVISDNLIEYRVRTNLDYMPDLGKILLSYVGEKSYLSLKDPDLPTLGDEALYRLHLKELKEAGNKSIETVTRKSIRKPDGEEVGEIESWARDKQMKAWMEFEVLFLEEINQLYQSSTRRIDASPSEKSKTKAPKRGSPGLPEKEWIDRLALAQEAIEMKELNPNLSWRQISIRVGWEYGITRASRVKSLEAARFKLRDLEVEDPDNLLGKIKERREKKEN